LISTIEYLFKGERELYKGLYIYSYNIGNKSLVIEDKWEWEETYPVIRIDFAKTQVRDEKELEKELKATIIETGKEYRYKYNKEYTINRNFELLLKRIYKERKKQVVILIDEYDKPILDNIENKKEVKKIREKLKGFYTILKGLDRYIRFFLITGVSEFAKVSLFSGLNQLKDISLDPRYGNICGYTQNELEFYFKDYLQGLNLDEIKEWYNGYYFLQDTLYNPLDILLYLDSKKFNNYWYETGNTEFLFKLLENKNYQLPYLTKAYYTNEILNKFDLEYINLEALMFQTGYLTIKEIQKIDSEEAYILDYPNKEIRQSFNTELLFYITHEYQTNITSKLKIAILQENIDEIKNQLAIFFSSISYQILKNEYVYQAAIYGLIYSMGYNIIIEDNTSKGRIDLTINI
jgi:hypothetical protein